MDRLLGLLLGLCVVRLCCWDCISHGCVVGAASRMVVLLGLHLARLCCWGCILYDCVVGAASRTVVLTVGDLRDGTYEADGT